MADFTKSAIKHTFLQLLKQYPLSEISIKDITSACGISRNSFYYHYRDVPELIDKVIDEYAFSVVEKYSSFGSVGEFFDHIIGILLSHKKEAMHIFRSMDRGMFDLLLMSFIERFVKKHICSTLADVSVSDDNKKTIISFYKCFYFGTMIEWLNNDMNEGFVEEMRRIFAIKNDWTVGFADLLEKRK